MHPKTEKLFQQLEDSRNRLISIIQSYPQSVSPVKPSPEEWSMAQVAIHLAITEIQILGYVQRKLLKGELQDSNLRSWLRYMVVLVALRYRKKIKAPKQVALPPEGVTLAEAIAKWEEVRGEWEKFLTLLPAGTIHKNIFKHPLTGFLNILQTLGFMNEHVCHHIHQIHRIGETVSTK
ncbi:DinB family protein [Rhodocytophaga rosea]|uniref:DinB family protein n=1 Tax=Rhodocytophaga rosea TaxID=2704465 RepID=A0A6C0GE50_9BACT|nr:DinB family protein [Rhodocytophaga rosea]QHT66104.1 DinB family protein [Rhodocytophaga rosea]